MGTRTFVIASLVVVIGLGVAVVLYLGTRMSTTKRPVAAATAARSRRQTPKPSKPPPTGPHDRPVPILMYHLVGSLPPGAPYPNLYVSRRDFVAQIRWLARRGYHAVTLGSVFRYWRGRSRLPSRPIVLSFDDGYRQDFTVVTPLLERRRWPAVLNLEYAHLVHQDLTGPMIRQMLADGWELDSHTLTHPDLRTVDLARLRREVARSRQLIRRRFGVPVEFFCYPAGLLDDRVVHAVRAAGYRGATTVRMGLARPSQPFRLARIRVDRGDTPRDLARKLAEAR